MTQDDFQTAAIVIIGLVLMILVAPRALEWLTSDGTDKTHRR